MARLPTYLVLVAFFGASIAQAQSDDTREQARQHYGHGIELSAQGDYAAALEEFLAAYRIRPNFAVLYNIGQAYVALGRPSEAAAALEQYLRDGKDQVAPERIAQTTAQIAAQEALVVQVTVLAAPGSSIRIDGQVAGRAPLTAALRVAPGAHLISVVAADGSEVSRSVTLQAGQKLELKFEAQIRDATSTKPTGTLRITCSEPLQIWVDGMRVISPASNPRISLDEGSHRVVLARRGRRSPEQTVDIQAGSGVIMECDEGADLSGSAPKPADKSSGRVSTIGYALGGAGVGLGVAALGQYLWNRGRYEAWKNADAELSDPAATNRRQRQIDNNALAGSIERASRVTVSLVLGSGALLATGSTLIVVDARTSKTDAHSGVNALSVSLCGVW